MDSKTQPRRISWAAIWAVGVVAAATALPIAAKAFDPPLPLRTTKNDFFLKGTQPTPAPFPNGQPNPNFQQLIDPSSCRACHGGYDPDQEPYTRWVHSMMAQSFRDLVFRAQLSIAEKDAAFSGDACLRCHTPAGWVSDRATPTDGSNLSFADVEGVQCSVCHRMVDTTPPPPAPRPEPNSPIQAADWAIYDALGSNAPNGLLSGGYIIDPQDRRRGPFDLGPSFFLHPWFESPLHRSSALCASCHDISNPIFTRQPGGTYALNALNTPHPTGNKYDMFPLDRLYSEWANSAFAVAPVNLNNRFGGQQVLANGEVVPQMAYSTCQDCHMPRTTGQGCEPFIGPPVRDDLPLHNFAGANTWMLNAIRNVYDDAVSGLEETQTANAIARARQMLASAADVTAVQSQTALNVRVTNQAGHRLPGGFPEGRRMWLNVRFFGPGNTLIAERGHYNAVTATLEPGGTKVYEAKLGMDAAMAALTGYQPGPGFHLDLNNVRFFDNRIPPRGFSNAAFAAVQAEPVGYAYVDGQHWDDTPFTIPTGAVRAEVRLFHQTTTREYIEFLRDNDTTIPFDNVVPWGTVAHEQWVLTGKSEPTEMALVEIVLTPPCTPDYNGDGFLNTDDLSDFITDYFTVPPVPGPGGYALPGGCSGAPAPYDTLGYRADYNKDCALNTDDLSDFITAYFLGC